MLARQPTCPTGPTLMPCPDAWPPLYAGRAPAPHPDTQPSSFAGHPPAPHPDVQSSSFAGHPPAHPSHSATSLASLRKITLVRRNPSCLVCHQCNHAETVHHITIHQQLLEWRCTHCHSTPTLAPSVPTHGTQPAHAHQTTLPPTLPPSRLPTHPPSRPPTRHLPSLARWPARPVDPSLTPHPDTRPSSYAGRTPILHTTP